MKLNKLSQHQKAVKDFIDIGMIKNQDDMSITPVNYKVEQIERWTNDIKTIACLLRQLSKKGIFDVFVHQSLNSLFTKAKSKSQHVPLVLRPDAVISDGQLKLLELNIDSAVAGMYESDLMQTQFLSESDNNLHTSRNSLVEFFEDIAKNYTKNNKRRVSIAIVHFDDMSSYKMSMMSKLCKWLNRSDDYTIYPVVFNELYYEGNVVKDNLRAYDVVYKMGALIRDPDYMKPLIEVMEKALSIESKTILVSDPIDLAIDPKGSLAILSAAISPIYHTNIKLTSTEVALIEKYIPWTRLCTLDHFDFKDEVLSLTLLLSKYKSELVLKKTASHLGKHVFMGKEASDCEWKNLINIVMKDPSAWVIQENLYSDKVNFTYLNDSVTEYIQKSSRYIFCPYIFGDNYGGSLIRIEKDENARVLVTPAVSNTGFAPVKLEV